MDFLASGWRFANWPDKGGDGLPHANLPREEGKSLFESLEQSDLPDEQTYIVWRGERTFVILNVFPYTSGHVMVLPRVATPSLIDLDDDVHDGPTGHDHHRHHHDGSSGHHDDGHHDDHRHHYDHHRTPADLPDGRADHHQHHDHRPPDLSHDGPVVGPAVSPKRGP